MTPFLLGLALVVVFVLLMRWAATAEPTELLRLARKILVAVVLAGAVILILSGRFWWALAMAPVLIPWIARARWAARTAKNARRMMGGSGGSGEKSEVRTRFLDMTLDHDSGAMSGTVLEGRFAGRALNGLSLDQLLELLMECAADEGSQRLLESYLDQVHGEEWRERAAPGAGGEPGGAMTVEEARAVLDLQPGADAAAVKAAHRRLMSKIHPDRGGSAYLAAKINRAREVLLEALGE